MAELTTDYFAGRYRQMSESELMQLARSFDALSTPAQTALKAEFDDRSLEPPLLDGGDDEEKPLGPPVVVGRYRDFSEAIVARAVLETNGIGCFLRDENMLRLDWTLSNALGGMRLEVASNDAAEAEWILAAPRPASFEVDSGPAFVQPVCPKCGSLDIIADDTGRRIALASTVSPALPLGIPLLVGVPALALQPEGVWKCVQCGCRWQDDEDPESLEDLRLR